MYKKSEHAEKIVKKSWKSFKENYFDKLCEEIMIFVEDLSENLEEIFLKFCRKWF